MIELKNVYTVENGTDTALTDYSIVAKEGECLELPREEGTSVIKAILGFLPVTSGYITYDGMPLTVNSVSMLRKMLAYVPRPEGFEHTTDITTLQKEMVHKALHSDQRVILAIAPCSCQSEEDADAMINSFRQKAQSGSVVIITK